MSDKRQLDIEGYLELPQFLLADNRPADLQARTDARIRAFRDRQAGVKVEGARRKVPRLHPRPSE